MSASAWGAVWAPVYAMSLSVVGLVTAEMLPMSLLTPIATDLRITTGTAGQTISVTAVTALVASLLLPAASRRLDRRVLLLSFTGLLVASSLLAALAMNLAMLIVGRVLLGIALGGFWTMAPAAGMRLVPEAGIPRALAIIFGGGSFAAATAAPLGSALGAVIGWRGVFAVPAAMGLAALAWQAATLPAMAARGATRLGTVVEVLRRPRIGLAMAGILLVFAGYFAFFSYVRPLLEKVTGVDVRGLSAILLAAGVANFLGTSLAARLIGWNLRLTLTLMPLGMAMLATALAGLAGSTVMASLLIALLGMAIGTMPVSWSTWLTRTVADEAETVSGLLVAAVQLAISLGAVAGGLLFDSRGPLAPVAFSAVALLLAAAIIHATLRSQNAASDPAIGVTMS